MIPENPLIDAHYGSWDKLQKLLYVGNVPYINLSDNLVEIPQSLLPPHSTSSKKIDYEIIAVYFPSTVRSDGMLVVRPLEGPISRLVFKRPPVELFYFIPGTSVPPIARKIYPEERLVEDIIRANIENSFREVNQRFYSFYEYFRTNLYDIFRPERSDIRGILNKVLEPYVRGYEANIGITLSRYVKNITDYFLSKVRPESIAKKEKDTLIETFEYWAKEKGLKFLMEEPWEILRHTVSKEMDIVAEDRLFDMEDVYEIFSKYLYTTLKLEIDGRWKRLL